MIDGVCEDPHGHGFGFHVIITVGSGEIHQHGTHQTLHISSIDQLLLQKNQKSRLTRLTNLRQKTRTVTVVF